MYRHSMASAKCLRLSSTDRPADVLATVGLLSNAVAANLAGQASSGLLLLLEPAQLGRNTQASRDS